MVTKRHLAVLRAALQFFDEEMIPHAQDDMQYYFDPPLGDELKAEEIRELRDILKGCELRYACCDLTASRLIGPELSASLDEALSLIDREDYRVVTVLLLPIS